MLAYLSTVWAGTEDPLWPHVVLVPLSVVAGVAVGVGIVFERPKYCAIIHRIAFWLVVAGVFVESLCTVALFITDERTSLAQGEVIKVQQRRIAYLDEEIAPRALSDDKGNELIALFHRFPGRTVRVASYELDLEAGILGWQILKAAELANLPRDARLQSQDAIGGELIGVSVTGTDAEMVAAVTSLFSNFHLDPTPKLPPASVGVHLSGGGTPVSLAIFVGVKRPAWMPP